MVTIDKTDGAPQAVPRSEYERRQIARQAEMRQHERRENFAGLGRVVAFLAVLAVVYASVRAGHLLVPWFLLALAALVAAIVWHRRVVQALTRAQRATRYYAAALARLDDRWTGIGPSGERYNRPEHFYPSFRRSRFHFLRISRGSPVRHDNRWLGRRGA